MMWHTAPYKMQILEAEVHVWRCSLDLTVSQVDRMMSYLSSEEVKRADHFHFQKDRKRYIVSHGILREIINRYTAKNPACLSFVHNAFGKPFLSLVDNNTGLSFNLSHSHDMVVYAFTLKRQIGIDVEFVRLDLDKDSIAEYSFSSREVVQLQSLPDELQTKGFYNCWTRKEAFIKAKGGGMSIPLDRFDISLVPGQPVCLLRTQWDNNEANRWSLHDLNVGKDYAAAVAVEGRGWKLKYWDWLLSNSSNSCCPVTP